MYCVEAVVDTHTHTHTQEWRHAHGMRCLGIPNTAHFANVTNIEDARACESCDLSAKLHIATNWAAKEARLVIII